MLRSFDTSVLIVGAGPVGLTLAIDLAWRGIDVTVVDVRSSTGRSGWFDRLRPRCRASEARQTGHGKL